MATEEEVVGFINRNNEKFKFKLPLIKCKDIVDLDSYIASKCNGNSSTPILDDSDSDDIIDISGKADKVTSDFEAGDVVILDSNGNITSGGSKVTDFAGVSHTHSVSDITDLSSLFDESDSDDEIIIDSSFIANSTNAVLSKVIQQALSEKLNTFKTITINKDNSNHYDLASSNSDLNTVITTVSANVPSGTTVPIFEGIIIFTNLGTEVYRSFGKAYLTRITADTTNTASVKIYVDNYIFTKSGTFSETTTTLNNDAMVVTANTFISATI